MALYWKLVLVMACCCCSFQTSADSVTDGTELVLTFLVHRHGDRTPVESLMPLVDNTEELEQLIAPWGYGQLTNIGRRTGYKTGQFIRRRYDELLSDTYNRSEIYIRTTDSTRTKMTVLAAMAAVYPPVGDTWSDDINWVPTPYTTVPVKYDFNTAMINCPNFVSSYYSLLLSPTTNMEGYSDVLSELTAILGYNVSASPAMAYTIFDLFESEQSLGIDLGDDLNAIMPDVEAAAGAAIDLIFGDEDNIALQAGVLLGEFFDAASAAIAGEDTQRVRVYSAHDFNVYSLEAVSRVTPRQGVPKYGSVFALELRRVVDTGRYAVLPVYLRSPDNVTEIYLPVEGCSDLLCDLDEFKNITSKYVLTEDEWRTQCGWSSDLTFDSSSID